MDLEEEQAAATRQAVAAAVAEARELLAAEHAEARVGEQRLRAELDRLQRSTADEVAEVQMVRPAASYHGSLPAQCFR